jgi:predicted TIM-barrel fold metal-dependent hydrolase
MNSRRRQFLVGAAQAVVALGAAGAIRPVAGQAAQADSAAKPEAIPLVDTHQHLWDLSKLRLPWLKGDNPINRSFVMKDYREATEGLGVVKAVYMEVDVDPADQVAEAEYVLDICRRGDAPTCAAVIGGRPAEAGFRQYITRYKDSPYIKGVRHIPPVSEGRKPIFLEDPFVAGVRLLGELGMSFDLCVPPAVLLEGAKLIDRCPGTRFILDHCGNADVKQFRAARGEGPGRAAALHFVAVWRRSIAVIAQRKNVVSKISGIIASVPKEGWTPDDLAPIINHCLDSFGPDRVMFASDWPVCTLGAPLRRWVEALREVIRARPVAEQRKLLGENAIRFYGLG